MDWKAAFRPMKETVAQVLRDVASRVARTPRADEVTSPLREELKDRLQAKQDVGYAPHCPCCDGQRVIDAQVAETVASKEDPAPYLEGIYTGIVTLNEKIPTLITKLETTSEDVSPSARMKVIVVSVFAGFVGKGLLDLAMWLIPKILGIL